MATNVEIILTEETQIFLLHRITETVNPLVCIIHLFSFYISHVGNKTICLVIHSISQDLPSSSPSPSTQTLGLV